MELRHRASAGFTPLQGRPGPGTPFRLLYPSLNILLSQGGWEGSPSVSGEALHRHQRERHDLPLDCRQVDNRHEPVQLAHEGPDRPRGTA